MKRVYYKIFSKVQTGLELRKNAGLPQYWYEYSENGTKFAVTDLDNVLRLADNYNGIVYEIHEEGFPITRTEH